MSALGYRFELWDVVGFVRAKTRSRARMLVVRQAVDVGYGTVSEGLREIRLNRERAADSAPTWGNHEEGLVPTDWRDGYALLGLTAP